MVCGGFCVRLVSRVDLREAAPHWLISWCSMTPRCGKVHTHTQSVLVLNLFSIKFEELFDKFVTPGARNIYHQLLMNSLLMDLKYKKIFAVQFAKVTHRLSTYIFYVPPVLATKSCHYHQCADQWTCAWLMSWEICPFVIDILTNTFDQFTHDWLIAAMIICWLPCDVILSELTCDICQLIPSLSDDNPTWSVATQVFLLAPWPP